MSETWRAKRRLHLSGGVATSRGRRPAARGAVLAATLLLVPTILVLVGGCGSGITGGSFPPGEPDILGYVLAAPTSTTTLHTASATVVSAAVTPAADPAQAETWPPSGTPIPGATVYLLRGSQRVGATVTDATGRFAFDSVPTGQYEVDIQPPQGSGYGPQRKQFEHTYRVQTRLVIYLEPL